MDFGSSSISGVPAPATGLIWISILRMKKPMSSCRRKSVWLIHSCEVLLADCRALTLASSWRGGTACISGVSGPQSEGRTGGVSTAAAVVATSSRGKALSSERSMARPHCCFYRGSAIR